jgi:hypothetical protein
MIFENFTAMDWVAIWGAITGSVAIGLDVWRIKKDRPRLKLHCIQNAKPFPSLGDDVDVFDLSILNIGKYPTTVTHVVFRTYPNIWSFWRKKHNEQQLLLTSCMNVLEVGKKFSKTVSQKGIKDELMQSKDKMYTIEVLHTMSTKPVRKQIKL